MLVKFGAFCTVCMAGHTFGKITSPLGLPAITLFIFFGLACGPFGFELVGKEDYTVLSWINQVRALITSSYPSLEMLLMCA